VKEIFLGLKIWGGDFMHGDFMHEHSMSSFSGEILGEKPVSSRGILWGIGGILKFRIFQPRFFPQGYKFPGAIVWVIFHHGQNRK